MPTGMDVRRENLSTHPKTHNFATFAPLASPYGREKTFSILNERALHLQQTIPKIQIASTAGRLREVFGSQQKTLNFATFAPLREIKKHERTLHPQ